MSPRPSRLVALVASLALAGCSSIGVINGQRLDVGATTDADSTPHYWHPCEDFEWACIAGVASVVVLAVLLSQHSLKTPAGATAPTTVTTTPPPTPTPTPSP